jgi:hypothetical protein
MAALGVALIAAGGLGGFLAWQETSERTEVLAVAREVPVGDVIDDADLTVAAVSLDPAIKPIAALDRSKVVGQRAAVALIPGALLSHGHLTDAALVKSGEQLVGIGLKATQLPATRLSAGDPVVVVFTPGEASSESQGQGGCGAEAAPKEPVTVKARVVRIGERQQATGDVVVDVAVPAAEGPRLAAQAVTGRVALVIDVRGGGA